MAPAPALAKPCGSGRSGSPALIAICQQSLRYFSFHNSRYTLFLSFEKHELKNISKNESTEE